MSELLLGIDGGGSNTRALLASLDGTVLGRGYAPSSNLQSVGFPAATAAIRQAIAAAFDAAGIAADTPIAAACLGLAGVGRPADHTRIAAWIEHEAIARRSAIVTDAEPVLAAGTPEGWGVALISGTGSVCVGRDRQGRAVQVGGWGYLLGDEGSGYDLAIRALRLATQTADGRAEAHALLDAVLRHWNLAAPADLVGHVYRTAIMRPAIADLTRPVVALAAQGDRDALDLLEGAAVELARAARAAARRLGLHEPPVALAGGLLGASPELRAALAECLGPGWGPLRYVDDPALGTLVLARRLLTES